MELIEVKQCKRCGEHKPIETFDWTDKKKGYTKSYCRDCSKIKYKEWKEANPIKHKTWWNNYYAQHPEMFGLTGKPRGRKPKNGMKSGVYLLTNTITGETYVGCSNDVKRRIWRHLEYNRGRSKSKNISKAIKQYGKEAFTAEVLEYCPNTQIFEREAYWMTQYKCEYNRNKVGK